MTIKLLKAMPQLQVATMKYVVVTIKDTLNQDTFNLISYPQHKNANRKKIMNQMRHNTGTAMQYQAQRTRNTKC